MNVSEMLPFRSSGLAVAVLIGTSSATYGDVVTLKTGGVLRGLVTPVADKAAAAAEPDLLEIKLVSGAVVRVARADVAEVQKRYLKFEQYEAQRQLLDDTLEAHWELAEWCRQNNLPEQRRPHLERVLDFDPDHKPAHYGLGHSFQDGEWLTKAEIEERHREEGRIKFNGKYVPIGQLEALQQQAAQTKAERDWSAKIGRWLKWVVGNNSELTADGLNNLRGIRDEAAIPGLITLLSKHERPEVRALFVDIISQFTSLRAAWPLANYAVRENVNEIRNRALQSIRKEQQEVAQGVFIKALRDPNNTVVRRAGLALGRTGDSQAVPALIRALTTKHRFEVRVAVPTVSMNANGGGLATPFNLPPDFIAAVRAGQYPYGVIIQLPQQNLVTKVVPISLEIDNDEVRTALVKLTQQDFGFDSAAWTKWWNVVRHQLVIAPDLP